MRLFGLSIIQGMFITLGHFFNSYIQGVKRQLGMSKNGNRGAGASGVFTVQYPEERVPVPERFRVLPVLIYEENSGDILCTSCGICAKVCPPQCIWIVQAKGEDGKIKNKVEDFFIETNVCMNCGLCAEYCPFDAIKMDHQFELSTYVRKPNEVQNLQDLLVSTEYYARTHPKAWAEEEAKRAKKAALKPSPTAVTPKAAPQPAVPPAAPAPKETPPPSN